MTYSFDGFSFPDNQSVLVDQGTDAQGRSFQTFEKNGQTKTLAIGPRLEDRNIGVSAWGIPIPITFGVRRLNGNVIWSAPLDELVDKQTNTTYPGQSSIPSLNLPGLSAGFGTPGVKTITYDYYYFADFAVSFGYGDPTNADKYILRMWANGLLIYDAKAPGSDTYATLRTPVAKFDSLQFKFFPGTMVQEPSAVIQSYENRRYAEENETDPDVNVVPAMLGLMYVVFQGFPVTPFNNALPDISIELADATTLTNDIQTYDGASGITASQSNAVDWNNLLLYALNSSGSTIYTIDLTTLKVINTVTVARVKPMGLEDLEGDTIAGLDISRATGALYAHTPFGEPMQLFSVNPVTGVCAPLSQFSGKLAIGPYNSAFQNPTRLFITSYLYMGVLYDEIILSESSGGTKLFSSEGGSGAFLDGFYSGGGLREQYTPGETGVNRGIFYINFDGFIWKVQGDYKTQFCGGVGVSFFQYYEQYNGLLVCYDDGVTAIFHMKDVTSGADRWVSAPVGGGFANLEAAPLWKMDTKSNQALFLRGGATTILDLSNGKLIDARTLAYPSILPLGSGRFKAIFGSKDYVFLDQATAQRTNLKLFILFAARLAGLDVDSLTPQLTVDDTLASIAIDGSYMNEVGQSFRDLLDNLRDAFLFDIREQDNHINVTKRVASDSSNDFSFYAKNMLLLSDAQSAQALSIERREDDGIPVRLSYTFLDFMNEYQPNVAYAQRSGTSFSNRSAQISIPIIMRFSEAKVWAYKVLYSFWNTRESFAVRVPFTEIKTEPSDVGIINCDGRIYRVKVSSISYNTDWSMSIASVNFVDDADITYLADDPLGYVPALQYYSPSTAYFFDLPNVFPRDSDFIRDNRQAQLLFIAAPDVPTRRWQGAFLDFVTIYGASFRYLFNNNFPEIALVGTTVGGLGVPDTPFSIDEVNTLVVKVHPALTLSTISDDEFFSGSINVAAVRTSSGFEIISFRDVVDLGANMYRLSHFMRGRRGTEWQVANHLLSSTILFLVNNMQVQIPVDARAKDTQITVVATTQGRDTLKSTTHENIKGYWQLPYQPNGISATRLGDGTIEISWLQRTRAPDSETFVDGVPEAAPPEWENIRKFEIVFPEDDWFVIDQPEPPPGGQYFAVYELSFFDDKTMNKADLDPHKMTLTPANQTFFFGGVITRDHFNVAVYQHSKEWGRGVGQVWRINISDD